MREIGKKRTILGGRISPNWPEAMAKQASTLSHSLNAEILSIEPLKWRLISRTGACTCLNVARVNETPSWFWTLSESVAGLASLAILSDSESVILMGGIDSKFYGVIPYGKSCPIVSSPDIKSIKNLQRCAEAKNETRCFVAQSDGISGKISSLGVDPSRVITLYPVIDFDNLGRMTRVPSPEIPRILFASSPNFYDTNRDNYLEKGVSLLLEGFADLLKSRQAELMVLWRGLYTDRLCREIHDLGLDDRVDVIEGFADIRRALEQSHILVVPYKSMWRSPALPMSAIESICYGRPVITTNVCELSRFVARFGCGEVVPPEPKSFGEAVMKVIEDYPHYHRGCDDMRTFYCLKQAEGLKELELII